MRATQRSDGLVFVTVLRIESWVRNMNQIREVMAPTLQQIEAAIRELDGETRNLLTLGTGSVAHMGIGGGPSSYIVYATFDNDTFHNLIVPSAEGVTRLVAGGQESEYPARLCVGIRQALAAARTFGAFGTLDPALSWETQ